jgi:hypothetical protein
MENTITTSFKEAFHGRFHNLLRWKQMDSLWEIIGADAASGWYIYAIGETPPVQPASGKLVRKFLAEIKDLLRNDHEEDYCGIIYADSFERPGFVKIFDPNNLGVQCGFSENPPLPGWILSKLPPVDLQLAAPLSGNRRRWWQKLLGR